MAYLAFGMAIIKILFDLVIYVINKINQYESERLNSDGVGCKFLQNKDDEDKCTNLLFKKNMKDGICPRERCGGFNTGMSKIDDNTTFINIPWLFTVKKVVDLFPEFAAALLALNEII